VNCQNNNYRVIVDLNAIVHNVKNIEKSISVGSFFTLDRIVSIANGCDKSVRIQVKLEVQSGRDGFCLGDEGELKSRLRSVRAMKNVRSLF